MALPVTGITAEQLRASLNLKSDADAAGILAVADDECRRAFSAAFRAIPQTTWDNCILRVAGAIVGAKRRPAGGAGQLTTAEQPEPVHAPRDYTAPIRAIVANYAGPGLA